MPPARRLIAVLAALLVCLTPSAPAAAAQSTYGRLLHAYEQGGFIPACSFTSAQLEGVVRSVDTYAAQYFADFTNAIRTALAQRASGGCSTPQSARIPSRLRNTKLALPQVPAATSAGVPLPIVLLAAIGVVLLLVCGAGAIWMLTGSEPRWAPAWRHSWNEGEDQVAGGWSALVDRLRRRRTPRRRGPR